MARHALTLEFTEEVEGDIASLQDSIGVNDLAGLVKKALEVLKFLVSERERGGKIFIENEEGGSRKEVVQL